MTEPTSPLPGFKVTSTHMLTDTEYNEFEEIRSIRASAQDRLDVLHQKVLDCTRMIEGKLTAIKWREGWDDGDLVVYDGEARSVLSLKREGVK
jgi:hypothetical protein